jgi:hypothetical protein
MTLRIAEIINRIFPHRTQPMIGKALWTLPVSICSLDWSRYPSSLTLHRLCLCPTICRFHLSRFYGYFVVISIYQLTCHHAFLAFGVVVDWTYKLATHK